MVLKASRGFLVVLLLSMFSCNESLHDNDLIFTGYKTSEIPLSRHVNESSEMVKLLASINDNSDPAENRYINSKRVEYFKTALKNAEQSKIGHFWYNYCLELMRSGDAEECILELENHFDRRYPIMQQMTPRNYVLFELLAVAYLRLGEQENCQLNHNEYSCILPLQQPAVHTLPKGSTRAIAFYQSMYDRNPNEAYKWLINLAYMTLGKHPSEVPKKYLIEYPNWEIEQQNFPRFKEVGMNVNTAINGLSGSVCTDDFNNDGLMDIFVTDYGMKGQARLLINNGKGDFDDRTIKAGLTGIVGGLNCVQADYNNDGFVDIFVFRGAWFGEQGKHPNSLLKNNGDGTFSDVTNSAGLMSKMPTQTGAWADFNRDGFLDLFIGNESQPGSLNSSKLYLNNGDGTFKEVASKVGVDVIGFIKGAVWGDINNDNWPDLYLSIMGGTNILLKNNEGVFEDISNNAGIEEPIEVFLVGFGMLIMMD